MDRRGQGKLQGDLEGRSQDDSSAADLENKQSRLKQIRSGQSYEVDEFTQCFCRHQEDIYTTGKALGLVSAEDAEN